MSNGNTDVMTPGTGQMSATARLFAVFTEPSKTFADIARRPGFWAAMIVMIIISFITGEALVRHIGAAQIVRRSLELSGRAATMSPEQMQQAMTQGGKFVGIIPVFGLVIVPVGLLIFAAIGLLLLKVVFGSNATFKTAFSVAAHANLPMFIASILALLIIFFGDPASINPNNLVPTNIGFFLSRQAVGGALYSLATSMDVFSFWVMGLLGIGFSAASGGKVRARSMFLGFLILWVIYVLLRAGLSLI